MKAASLLLAALLIVPPSRAGGAWFESGDVQLRIDLQLLNDAHVIRLPSNQWPVPKAAVRFAIEDAKSHLATNESVMSALARVRQKVAADTGSLRIAASASVGSSGLFRDFSEIAREDGEIALAVARESTRVSVQVRATAASNPADGKSFRLGGSHATAHFGNWLLSANTLERWWGPGHEGSLILSNNARPMPTVMVERAEARRFETRWLNWLGPWRMSLGISRMEDERNDIDAPLFMAWRVAIMPSADVELGFSRTAQFCGKQLECNLDVFGNMLAGNDNVGIDATPENEPGHQMAGFDTQWNSPVGNLPYAVYAQYIGEDESSYLPAKYLAQVGFEAWKPLADGALIQVHAEYTSTTCSANSGSGPYYGCAYNQGLFNAEGYRYRGRTIGFTSDRDAENYAVGATFVASDSSLWTAALRSSRLNRDDFGDMRNTVSTVPATYRAIDFGWRGRLFGEGISIEVGGEQLDPAGGTRSRDAYGFLRWTHDFAP